MHTVRHMLVAKGSSEHVWLELTQTSLNLSVVLWKPPNTTILDSSINVAVCRHRAAGLRLPETGTFSHSGSRAII
jgi:hypothetical protein